MDAFLKEKEKEATRGEPRSDSQRPQPATERAAIQRVDGYIAAEPFVSANPPSPDAYSEAVKAELREVGAAIVSKAANETWKKRRSSA
jgi:hypothetical protein